MVVVGDFVGEIGDLGFKARALPANKTFANIAEQAGVFQRAVLENAFTGFEGQIQSVECAVTLFQHIYHPQ